MEEDVRMCKVKGKSAEQCQNYIRVLKLQAPDTLFVCGTNAYKPKCRTYAITVSITHEMRTREQLGEPRSAITMANRRRARNREICGRD